MVFTGSEQDGIRNEYIIGTAQAQGFRDKGVAEMVWTITEDGAWICWTRDVEDGAASWEEKRETTEKIHGCSDEGYAEDWCGKRGC